MFKFIKIYIFGPISLCGAIADFINFPKNWETMMNVIPWHIDHEHLRILFSAICACYFVYAVSLFFIDRKKTHLNQGTTGIYFKGKGGHILNNVTAKGFDNGMVFDTENPNLLNDVKVEK